MADRLEDFNWQRAREAVHSADRERVRAQVRASMRVPGLITADQAKAEERLQHQQVQQHVQRAALERDATAQRLLVAQLTALLEGYLGADAEIYRRQHQAAAANLRALEQRIAMLDEKPPK